MNLAFSQSESERSTRNLKCVQRVHRADEELHGEEQGKRKREWERRCVAFAKLSTSRVFIYYIFIIFGFVAFFPRLFTYFWIILTRYGALHSLTPCVCVFVSLFLFGLFMFCCVYINIKLLCLRCVAIYLWFLFCFVFLMQFLFGFLCIYQFNLCACACACVSLCVCVRMCECVYLVCTHIHT